MSVRDDAECTRRLVIESELAGPLYIEAALGMLVVGVDLLEIALQIGDGVEIGVDALHGGLLLLANRRRRAPRGFHSGVPASTLIAGIRVELACGRGSGWIGLRGIVGSRILRGDGAGGGGRLSHCRAVFGERNAGRKAKSRCQAQDKPCGSYAH